MYKDSLQFFEESLYYAYTFTKYILLYIAIRNKRVKLTFPTLAGYYTL